MGPSSGIQMNKTEGDMVAIIILLTKERDNIEVSKNSNKMHLLQLPS